MANQLEKVLRERGVTKRVELDLPTFSSAFELRLYGIYSQALRSITASLAKDIILEYKSELQMRDSVDSVLSSLDQKTVQAVLTFMRQWKAWSDDGARMHFKGMVSRLKYKTGIDLSTRMTARGEPATFDDLLRWNTELIRNISEEMRQKIASAVYSGLTSRTPPDVIAKQITEATGMARARARRIASDQTVKLSAALDNQRLVELGVDGYEWMHSGKLHFRPEHLARNGDYIKFGSKIDKEDPPGHAPFCGCKRRMVLN